MADLGGSSFYARINALLEQYKFGYLAGNGRCTTPAELRSHALLVGGQAGADHAADG